MKNSLSLELLDASRGDGIDRFRPVAGLLGGLQANETFGCEFFEGMMDRARQNPGPLLSAVENGIPRPVSPVYPQISQAIYKNIYSALSSGTSPTSALQTAQSQINSALKTF